jgi:hypothetical protein
MSKEFHVFQLKYLHKRRTGRREILNTTTNKNRKQWQIVATSRRERCKHLVQNNGTKKRESNVDT